jgi:F0F1-type ATP synthase membrane subunit b/b'
VSDVSERIEHLERTIELAQTGLDHAQRALSAVEKTHKKARRFVTMLRRVAIALVIGGVVLGGLSVLRSRTR